MSSKDHNIKITHCIFDMDGLLLDTERVYSEVTSEIVGRYGKEFTWELKSKMMGRVGSEAAELLVRELQIPLTAEEYLNERNQKHIAKFPTCRPLPGVERFIKHLKKNGILNCRKFDPTPRIIRSFRAKVYLHFPSILKNLGWHFFSSSCLRLESEPEPRII
ncbi:hypothetical protein DSO57_1021551 [Entomophthora muscae]|uniref:Uncharacterized protein n=1 Tax=Entomophthora muscae TaxID=34485 RepID=A0ACC2T3P3_9FUNG|nr:hypothetical protein DSO57_1021551 [Entomophthora muscae]